MKSHECSFGYWQLRYYVKIVYSVALLNSVNPVNIVNINLHARELELLDSIELQYL